MRKKRVVMVGCGSMSGTWLKCLRGGHAHEAELVGLVDLVEEAAKRRADELGFDNVWIGNDLEKAIDETGADVVFNCTVPVAHYELTKLALEKGCHVLIEKPLTETVAEAQELIALAEREGKILSVIQNRRYNGNIRKVVQLIQDGRIGKVNTMNVDFYMGAHFGGFREEMDHVLLLDMAIHTFDQARYLGGVNPRSVFCYEYNPQGSVMAHGGAAMAIFEMSEDVVFNYRGSWVAEGEDTSWYGEWRIVGEKGTILWDGAEDIRISLKDESNGLRGLMYDVETVHVQPMTMPKGRETHGGVMYDFFEAIQSGVEPLTSGKDNVHSLMMVEGAIQSAETGERVKLGS